MISWSTFKFITTKWDIFFIFFIYIFTINSWRNSNYIWFYCACAWWYVTFLFLCWDLFWSVCLLFFSWVYLVYHICYCFVGELFFILAAFQRTRTSIFYTEGLWWTLIFTFWTIVSHYRSRLFSFLSLYQSYLDLCYVGRQSCEFSESWCFFIRSGTKSVQLFGSTIVHYLYYMFIITKLLIKSQTLEVNLFFNKILYLVFLSPIRKFIGILWKLLIYL